MIDVELELRHFVVDAGIVRGMDYDEVSLIANFYDYDNKDKLVSDMKDVGVIVSEVTEK
jgi:hypothetical protein